MNIEDIYPILLTLVTIGLLLGVGLLVLGEVRTQIATVQTGTAQNSVNATATTPTNTTTLTDSTRTCYNLISVSVVNETTGIAIPTANYSSSVAGVITWTPAFLGSGDDEIVNISSTYNYDVEGSSEQAMSGFTSGIGGFGDWFAVIVVVIAAAMVLGIVLSNFGRRTPGV